MPSDTHTQQPDLGHKPHLRYGSATGEGVGEGEGQGEGEAERRSRPERERESECECVRDRRLRSSPEQACEQVQGHRRHAAAGCARRRVAAR